MKPKDLHSPYTWDERRVMIRDKIWHVPKYCSDYESFPFPGWSSPELFGNEQPVVVEYCCGNGTWVASKAQQDPHRNWVAVEMRFERVRKVWSKIQNLQLNNLIVIYGEACLSTRLYFPSASIDEVYVNFPDPWPKKRHAKNRLLQGEFLQQLGRVLRPKGSVTVATDDADYSGLLISEFQQRSEFSSSLADPFYVTQWENYGASYFDSLWRDKGREIRYHQFSKAG